MGEQRQKFTELSSEEAGSCEAGGRPSEQREEALLGGVGRAMNVGH